MWRLQSRPGSELFSWQGTISSRSRASRAPVESHAARSNIDESLLLPRLWYVSQPRCTAYRYNYRCWKSVKALVLLEMDTRRVTALPELVPYKRKCRNHLPVTKCWRVSGWWWANVIRFLVQSSPPVFCDVDRCSMGRKWRPPPRPAHGVRLHLSVHFYGPRLREVWTCSKPSNYLNFGLVNIIIRQ